MGQRTKKKTVSRSYGPSTGSTTAKKKDDRPRRRGKTTHRRDPNRGPNRKKVKAQFAAKYPGWRVEWLGGRLYRSQDGTGPILIAEAPEMPSTGREAVGIAGARPAPERRGWGADESATRADRDTATLEAERYDMYGNLDPEGGYDVAGQFIGWPRGFS